MSDVIIPVKLIHPDAQLPQQKEGDVGFDLYAVEDKSIPPHATRKINTGLQLAGNIRSDGCNVAFLKIEGRSGVASFGTFPIGGVIDPSYRGEIIVVLHNGSNALPFVVRKGDRVAQLVCYTAIATSKDGRAKFVVEDNISNTARGANGFGSTGI